MVFSMTAITSSGRTQLTGTIRENQIIPNKDITTFIQSVIDHDFTAMQELINKYGKTLNLSNTKNNNLLHMFFKNSFNTENQTSSINEKSINCMQLLISLGISPYSRNTDSKTPLNMLYDSCFGYNTLEWDATQIKFLSSAFRLYYPLSQTLADIPILIYAVLSMRMSLFPMLVECGANPDAVGEHGQTVLHVLTLFLDQPDKKPITDAIKVLFEKTAKPNPNLLDKHGYSPVHYAVMKGDIEITRLLFENGGKPNLKSGNNSTLLHISADHNLVEMTRFLLEHEIDPDAINNDNRTALYHTVDNHNLELAQLLLKRAVSHGPHLKYAKQRRNATFVKALMNISAPRILAEEMLHDAPESILRQLEQQRPSAEREFQDLLNEILLNSDLRDALYFIEGITEIIKNNEHRSEWIQITRCCLEQYLQWSLVITRYPRAEHQSQICFVYRKFDASSYVNHQLIFGRQIYNIVLEAYETFKNKNCQHEDIINYFVERRAEIQFGSPDKAGFTTWIYRPTMINCTDSTATKLGNESSDLRYKQFAKLLNACYKTQFQNPNSSSEVSISTTEKEARISFSYAPDIQHVPISLTTCVFRKECEDKFSEYKISTRSWSWQHSVPKSLETLWPLEEQLFNELWNDPNIRGKVEARNKIKLYYLLTCHGPLIGRGFSCITIMLYTLLSMRHQFNTMPVKIEVAEPNCMAISMGISKGLAEFDSWFESQNGVERCLKLLRS